MVLLSHWLGEWFPSTATGADFFREGFTMSFIYACFVRGLSHSEDGDIDNLPVDICENMEDVRSYLLDMGYTTFERVLKVPENLIETIDSEYGIH